MFYFIAIPSILSSIVYFLLIRQYKKGWDSLRSINNPISSFPLVSVVVACRNEEKTILSLIESLTLQSYPSDKYEIIIVDDFSTDNTLNLLKNNEDDIIVLSSPNPGKKMAVAHAIVYAKGELILTTDADCVVPDSWIQSHVALYLEKKPCLQLGLVDYSSDNIFQKMLTLEFYSLVASAAGSAAIGNPVLCNAANMAFVKKIFLETKNKKNQKIPSGDDVFLLQEIKKKYPDKIAFVKSKDCIVKTRPPQSLKEFLNQRIRWASKNKYYSDRDIITTGAIVFFLNFLLFANIILSFLDTQYLYIFILALLPKTIGDYCLLHKVTQYFGKKNLLRLFLPVQLIYPIYVVGIGFVSLFFRYRWKERKY